MPAEHRAPHAAKPGGGQAAVGGFDGGGLDVQPQHAAVFPGQPAQKQRVVAVAAGGVHIQPAGAQPRGEQLVAERDGA